jgi:hypothetical protein
MRELERFCKPRQREVRPKAELRREASADLRPTEKRKQKGGNNMADFMQSSESKNAARTLAVPISDVSTF